MDFCQIILHMVGTLTICQYQLQFTEGWMKITALPAKR